MSGGQPQSRKSRSRSNRRHRENNEQPILYYSVGNQYEQVSVPQIETSQVQHRYRDGSLPINSGYRFNSAALSLPKPEFTNALPKHVMFILQTLLSHNGVLPFQTLNSHFGRFLQDNVYVNVHPDLRSSILQFPNLLQVIACDGKAESVSVKCPMGLCAAHASELGCPGSCGDLHLCKFFLQHDGACKFAHTCKFGHDIYSPHNSQALQDHSLLELNINHIRILLAANKPVSRKVPQTCKFYNNLRGCGRKEGCIFLHICLHYVKGDCLLGHKRCKRSHNILDPQPKALLMKFGVNVARTPQEILNDIREALVDTDVPAQLPAQGRSQSHGRIGATGLSAFKMQSVSDLSIDDDDPLIPPPSHIPQSRSPSHVPQIRSPSHVPQIRSSTQPQGMPQRPSLKSAGPAQILPTFQRGRTVSESTDGDEDYIPYICMYYLRQGGTCLYGKKCKNLHLETCYQWQYKMGKNDDWRNFDKSSNKEIELNYEDPTQGTCMSSSEELRRFSPFKVCFETMKVTWSSMVGGYIRRLSTVSSVNTAPSLTAATHWRWYWLDEHQQWNLYTETGSSLKLEELEESYITNPEGTHCFETTSNSYIIKFKRMCQRNTYYHTERKIRRRPDPSTISQSGTTNVTETQQVGAANIPGYWDRNAPSVQDGIQLVQLDKESGEYQDVEKLFHKTMKQAKVRKITRIQNQELWEGYMWKKNWMKNKDPAKQSTLEKHLFHGTKKDYYEAICQQGFDWRISGSSVGTAYGKGSYFARDASYSDCYTDSKLLFVVRVLVGSYARGKPEYVRPPVKNPSKPGDLYDSCVDSSGNPTIFVVFERQHSYPEYMISYE